MTNNATFTTNFVIDLYSVDDVFRGSTYSDTIIDELRHIINKNKNIDIKEVCKWINTLLFEDDLCYEEEYEDVYGVKRKVVNCFITPVIGDNNKLKEVPLRLKEKDSIFQGLIDLDSFSDPCYDVLYETSTVFNINDNIYKLKFVRAQMEQEDDNIEVINNAYFLSKINNITLDNTKMTKIEFVKYIDRTYNLY